MPMSPGKNTHRVAAESDKIFSASCMSTSRSYLVSRSCFLVRTLLRVTRFTLLVGRIATLSPLLCLFLAAIEVSEKIEKKISGERVENKKKINKSERTVHFCLAAWTEMKRDAQMCETFCLSLSPSHQVSMEVTSETQNINISLSLLPFRREENVNDRVKMMWITHWSNRNEETNTQLNTRQQDALDHFSLRLLLLLLLYRLSASLCAR